MEGIDMETKNTSYGIGFFGLLAIVFITLKLIGVIGWSWVWVLSPIWIPWSLLLAAGVVYILILAARRLNEK
jgi:hypothetical protein